MSLTAMTAVIQYSATNYHTVCNLALMSCVLSFQTSPLVLLNRFYSVILLGIFSITVNPCPSNLQ